MLDKFERSNINPRLYFWIIFFIAFFIRLIFLTIFDGFERSLDGDEGAYHSRAIQILSGDFIGTSERPPLLGILIAPIYFVFGNDLVYARLLMVCLSSFTASSLFVLCNIFTNKYYISGLCALILAIYPPSIWYSGWILTETLSSLLVLIAVIYLYKFINNKSCTNMVYLGTIFGLLAITRSLYLFLPIAILLFYLAYCFICAYRITIIRDNLKALLLGVLMFLVVLSPWILHNMVLYERFIPHSTQGGHLLLVSNGMLDNPDVQSGKYTKDILEIPELVNSNNLNAYEFDLIKRKIALNSIKSNLTSLPQPVFNRVKNFWTFRPDPYDPLWTTNDSIMAIIWIPIMTFFIIGIFSIPIRVTVPFLLVILYACVMVIPFWGSPRFRFPVDALIILTAFLGVLRTNIFGWSSYLAAWSSDNE